jgi:cellobiose phosphorylase
LKYFNSLSNIKIETENKAMDVMFNDFLPYQIVSSRLNARCSFYQLGGAVGFRDQLQDCLALVYSNPERLREQILTCCARQYVEGDVMHWWHPEFFGVRTKISDDKFFLPYAVFHYVEATGDRSILGENVAYLVSSPLGEKEHARLEIPAVSEQKGTVLEHCERAIDCGLKFGEHGLVLIGTGDWNDALDAIGGEGRGESVWLSMFAYEVLVKYKNCPHIPDRMKYIREELKLKTAVNEHGFDKGQFKRAVTDNGEWLGDADGKVCSIDLLSQAYAVISGICDEFKGSFALDAAKKLVDKENAIIKLLAPPFNYENHYGYISAYPEGIRENGGQYTHAAMWYLIALSKAGRIDEAYELFNMINPANKFNNFSLYKGEPYVFSADVYAGEHAGRAGWSWYTGSAAWGYRFILENLLGVTIKNNHLIINPNLPKKLNAVKIKYIHKLAEYDISITRNGKREVFLNSKPIPQISLPLTLPLINEQKKLSIEIFI